MTFLSVQKCNKFSFKQFQSLVDYEGGDSDEEEIDEDDDDESPVHKRARLA